MIASMIQTDGTLSVGQGVAKMMKSLHFNMAEDCCLGLYFRIAVGGTVKGKKAITEWYRRW